MTSRFEQFLGIGRWAASAIILIVPLLVLTLVVDHSNDVLVERIVTNMFCMMVLVVGLQTFSGLSGLLSFGHISFMGIGAYTAVLLVMPPAKKAFILPNLPEPLAQIGVHFIPGILIAAVFTTAVAALIGVPLMRLSGFAATMATFAMLIITNAILMNADRYTRGVRTMYGLENHTTLWMSALWAIFVILGGFVFKESRVGLMLRASREQEDAASTSGVNVIYVRWVAFTISAFITALGGALWAYFVTTFAPQFMFLDMTFQTVVMLVVGGMNSVSGAVVGTVVITALFELLRNMEGWISTFRATGETAAGFTDLWLGIGLILVLVWRSQGLTMGQEIQFPTSLRRWLGIRLLKHRRQD